LPIGKTLTIFKGKEEVMDKKQDRKGMDRRTFVKTAVAGAAGLTLSSWGVPTLLKAANEPLKIGCIFPLTGPISGYGLPAKAAMEYLCEKMNAKDGIMGRKIVPVIRDEQMSPEVTVRALKDLVVNEGCTFVHGTLSSADGIAASMAVKDMNGKAFFAAYGASSVITEEKGHRYVLRSSGNSTSWTRCAAIGSVKKWGKEIKTIYCINPDFAFGHSMHDEFVAYWKEHAPHAKFIGEKWPPLGCTDFTSYITAIISAKPDLLQSSIYGGDATIFMKQASAYGLLKRMKMVSQDLGLMAFLNDIRKGDPHAPIGVLGGALFPFYLSNDPEVVEFYTEVHKRSKWYPSTMSPAISHYLKLLKFAMEKAGTTTDLEKIIDVYDGGMTVDSLGIKYEMRGCDHQGMAPNWVGTLDWDPTGKFPFPILGKDTVILDNNAEIYHSCEEVRQRRLKEGNTYWYKKV
jgi:branched-chain amino acid transport system substrate-binding protein